MSSAPPRATSHAEHPPPPVPAGPTLGGLREAIGGCRACELWEHATQPVDSELAELVTVTAHPSSILRAREERERAEAMEQFVDDLENVHRWLSAR